MLSIFGHLGRLLPSYVEGERQAIEDNWKDLENYNQVQAGQYQNAFTADTFDERSAMMQDAAAMSDIQEQQARMNWDLNAAAFPGLLSSRLIQSRWQPTLTNAQMLNMGLMYNMMPTMLQRSMRGGYGGDDQTALLAQLMAMYGGM